MRRILHTGLVVMALAAAREARAADAPAPPPAQVRAWQTGLTRADRLQHASLAFTSGLAAGLVSRRPAGAGGVALTLGLAKELWDARRSSFDPVDLAADLAGAALATLATAAFER
ncbi:MAG: hypothetical protein HZC42_13370 [Candidatus Eisenbacteria bacterium]|nr:hypothetical protein [Candidatus Eisenbacteria bacterium]